MVSGIQPSSLQKTKQKTKKKKEQSKKDCWYLLIPNLNSQKKKKRIIGNYNVGMKINEKKNSIYSEILGVTLVLCYDGGIVTQEC